MSPPPVGPRPCSHRTARTPINAIVTHTLPSGYHQNSAPLTHRDKTLKTTLRDRPPSHAVDRSHDPGVAQQMTASCHFVRPTSSPHPPSGEWSVPPQSRVRTAATHSARPPPDTCPRRNGGRRCVESVPPHGFTERQRVHEWDCTDGTNQKRQFVDGTCVPDNALARGLVVTAPGRPAGHLGQHSLPDRARFLGHPAGTADDTARHPAGTAGDTARHPAGTAGDTARHPAGTADDTARHPAGTADDRKRTAGPPARMGSIQHGR